MSTDSPPSPASPNAPQDAPRDAPAIVPLLAFWATFVAVVVATGIILPKLFLRQDPDSLMRIVQVRDLLGGQGWSDLVQHRLDPPAGSLMHWSRLIDAPIAALIRAGNALWPGIGERFALTLWPLVLLLAYMAGVRAIASALAGRDASLPALILSLLFFSPLLMFTPGNIDHHNAQIALVALIAAALLHAERRPAMGLLAGCLASLNLAIGLEMLPALAVLSAFAALRWAWSGTGSRGTALFGASLAVAPALLTLAAGSPQARLACDSLSFAYAAPLAVGGLGLAALASLRSERRATRLGGLAAVTAGAAGVFAAVNPQCLGGPYGFLLPELKARFLDTVSEAEPLPTAVRDDPVAMLGIVMPPVIGLAVALARLTAALRFDRARVAPWMLAAGLVATPLALSFYQVRSLPLANAMALTVLAAWVSDLAVRAGATASRPRSLWPAAAALVLVVPFTWIGLGAAVDAGLVAAGRHGLAADRPGDSLADAPGAAAKPDPDADPEGAICTDAASVRLLASVTTGLVLSPVFYGSTVLAFSPHAVVAAPYHRAQAAILDSIRAMEGRPDAALAILRERRVDYLAICSVDRAAERIAANAPQGLLAQLLKGASIPGLQPIPTIEPTALRLWRVATP